MTFTSSVWRSLAAMATVVASLLVVACGGGGGGTSGDTLFSGSSSSGSTGGTGSTKVTAPVASNLVLTLSASTLANNGSQTVTATALALDTNNNTLVGVPVTIAADTGVVTPSGKVTGSSGALNAAIGIGADATKRTITITATSGSLTRTATLVVVDSTGGTSTGPSDLLLILSSPTIINDGTQTVTANVTALDAKRNVMPGVLVSFSVIDPSATIAPIGTATGATGVMSAVVGIGGSPSLRTIIVTASAGGLTRTATLAVTTSPVAISPVAADLALSLSASTINNSGSGVIVATATAVDSGRRALVGIPVNFSVDSNAVVIPGSLKTDASGVVTANVNIGADRTNRVITVTASSGTITKSLPLAVTGAKLSASLSPVVNAGSTGNSVAYKLLDSSGLAMPGQAISITAGGLPSVAGVTDINGAFAYSYTAPAAPGSLTLLATAAGDALSSTVAVLVTGTVPVASTVPLSASLTPSPSVIAVNTVGSVTNQVQLRALFVGPGNAPIQNIRVRFDLAGNASSSDGVVSYVGSYAYSDASGVARGTFTPGQISSPTDGVTVRACWDLIDFAAGTCPNAVSSTLTVASEALSISIRTDNTVGSGAAGLTYIKQYVVMVVDSAGRARAGALITPSVDLPSYYKGVYNFNPVSNLWEQSIALASTEAYQFNTVTRAWGLLAPTAQPSCPNEDVNRNGVREATAYDATVAAPALAARGEDLNWNGSLDPRKADVAVSVVGSATTDASGLAIVQIEYGKNLASWVDFVITVTATGISGTEARAQYSGLLYGVGNLPFLAKDITDKTVPPAFVVSPYGRASVCTNPN